MLISHSRCLGAGDRLASIWELPAEVNLAHVTAERFLAQQAEGEFASAARKSHRCAASAAWRAMMSDDPFFALRDRAYELAETGRFKAWGQVADALQAEGFLPTLITRLDGDGLAVMMITRCCGQARP